jgi:hypothetical protein
VWGVQDSEERFSVGDRLLVSNRLSPMTGVRIGRSEHLWVFAIVESGASIGSPFVMSLGCSHALARIPFDRQLKRSIANSRQLPFATRRIALTDVPATGGGDHLIAVLTPIAAG